MDVNLAYMIPELLELNVPGGVVAGESGRNADLRGEEKLWTHFTDDTDDEEVSDAEDDDLP